MPLRSVLVMLTLLLIGGFVALNWPAFTAPASLNLLFLRIEAAPALIMLGLLLLVVLVFLGYLLLWQSSALLQSRRHSKEMDAQRQRADEAEASRFTSLRTLMLEEFQRQTTQLIAGQDSLRQELREQANALAAAIAELDDRLQRPR